MFTQSCIIRKNTSELRNKLEEFGYIDTYCEECILASLDDDNFEQYNNFCI